MPKFLTWQRRPVDGAPLHELDMGDGVKAIVVHAKEWGTDQWAATVQVTVNARTMREAKAKAEDMAEAISQIHLKNNLSTG